MMKNDKKSKSAGGIFIALGMIAGAISGVFTGQPSAGMVIGLVAGIGIALLIWLIDSRRS